MSPITPEDEDLQDVPHRGTATRAKYPEKHREPLVDGPAARGDVRVRSPQRTQATKRKSDIHNEEPDTKVITRNDCSDDDDGDIQTGYYLFGPQHGPFIKSMETSYVKAVAGGEAEVASYEDVAGGDKVVAVQGEALPATAEHPSVASPSRSVQG